MADFEKIKDENLENVTGGARRYIDNGDAGYANIRSGPGTGYEVEYSLNNGQSVYTTGYTVYSERIPGQSLVTETGFHAICLTKN